MEKSDSFSEKPKRKTRKPAKKDQSSDIPEVSSDLSTTETEIDEKERKQAISKILKNSVEKYANSVDNPLKESRTDFEALQPIVSEFLEDFMIIGHTLDGQRVVMRYTSSPAKLDALTELTKKVLTRMMIQEQMGE